MKKQTHIIFALLVAGSFSFTSCTGCEKKTGDDGTRVEHKDGPGIGDGSPESYEEGDEGNNNYNNSSSNQGSGNSDRKQTKGTSKNTTDGSSPANQVTPSGSQGTGIFPGKTEGDSSGGNSKNNARTVSPGGRGNSGSGRPY